ncbi:MAG: alanine racemase [Alphaproteobacteria bacterium]|nr:alanine racemase [Alphaproteobacteria bacterium]
MLDVAIDQTPEQTLAQWRTPSDNLSVSANGDLMIEGVSARDLVTKFGSPLYVISESTLRQNYRRIKAAFEACWPEPINVMYAIKANPNLSVRAILHDEGAGGDCFSVGEIQATFEGGADPAKIVVNGSYKPEDVIERAIEMGLTINLDSEEEVDAVESAARRIGKDVRVGIRIKVLPEEYFKDFSSDCFKRPNFFQGMRRSKWGETAEAAKRIIRRLQGHEHLRLFGYHTHIGRASRDPQMFAAIGGELAKVVSELYHETGFSPMMIDLGGGWARERDPESSGDLHNPNPIEDYARAVCTAMGKTFHDTKTPLPQIWLEPGRYIVGNAGVLLTTIGLIKRDPELGLTWVNVDSSTNNLLQVDLFGYTYVALAAEGMRRPLKQKVDLVGLTCVPSVFARDCPAPDMKVGEIVALLDAGMYAEAKGYQFNSLPRPATALVSGKFSWLIRRRETVEDVFSTMVVPERFKQAK